ncbi:hypothetical protein BT69DRAFT_1291482, partial [Atractiella rhizophila]
DVSPIPLNRPSKLQRLRVDYRNQPNSAKSPLFSLKESASGGEITVRGYVLEDGWRGIDRRG